MIQNLVSGYMFNPKKPIIQVKIKDTIITENGEIIPLNIIDLDSYRSSIESGISLPKVDVRIVYSHGMYIPP